MHLQIDNGHDHTIIVREDKDPQSLLPGCVHENLFAQGESYRAFLTFEQRDEANVILYGSMSFYNGSTHSKIWRAKYFDITVAQKEFSCLKKALEARINHYSHDGEVSWDYSRHQDLTFSFGDKHITFSPESDNYRNSSITRWREFKDGHFAEVRYRELERNRRIIIDCVSIDPHYVTPLSHYIEVIESESATKIASQRGNDFMNQFCSPGDTNSQTQANLR